MQLLCFSIGSEDYAIESRLVVEVIPFVAARPLPKVPDFLLGVFVYRGRLVPLVDLCRLLASARLPERLSTRVIVVEFPFGPGARRIRLGLAAEKVVSLCSDSDAEACLPGFASQSGSTLGRLLRIGGRTLQVLDVERLLPAELLATLVASAAGSTAGRSEP